MMFLQSKWWLVSIWYFQLHVDIQWQGFYHTGLRTQTSGFIVRSLFQSKMNYSLIEKEALVIFFSVSKLKQYLLGNFFIISTDHKPLFSICGESRGLPVMAAIHMQRWALILSGFFMKLNMQRVSIMRGTICPVCLSFCTLINTMMQTT